MKICMSGIDHDLRGRFGRYGNEGHNKALRVTHAHGPILGKPTKEMIHQTNGCAVNLALKTNH